jgi:hypothetical protein
MDYWLTNEVKELLCQPCLDVSYHVGNRLNNRLALNQNINETALTEDVLDLLHTQSTTNVWGKVISPLQERGIYLSTTVHKSTREYETGADIGIILTRNISQSSYHSKTKYACLIQCKKISNSEIVIDFFHEVEKTKAKQSSLLLDTTSSSYYFIYVPTKLVKTYSSIEPMVFMHSRPECSSPIWNMGYFEYDLGLVPVFSEQQKASAAGILVVPALAVEANRYKSKNIKLDELLPNSIPFWYWFVELFVPAFVGDRASKTLAAASNRRYEANALDEDFGVKHTLEVQITID